MKLTIWERLKFWCTCTRDAEGNNCCCPSCCDYCRQYYIESKLTEHYVTELTRRLRKTATRALRLVQGLMLFGMVIGATCLVRPDLMRHPNRLAAAMFLAVSAFNFWLFYTPKRKAN